MKRCLLFVLLIAVTAIAHAQLEEDFNPIPDGWVLSQGAGFGNVNSNSVIITPGVGGNNPASIGTPAVNKTSNTVKVCFDINAYDANLNNQTAFPCATYADILFVNSAVNSSKDAEKVENIYARQDNYLLPTNGGSTCFTFTFPAAVTATSFKVFISFHAGCTQSGTKYVFDNLSISGVTLICGGTNCPPVALNDAFIRGNGAEASFNGALYGSNISYPGGNTVDAGGTDNDQNDVYADLQWSVLTQPVNGTVTVNSDGTFTIARNSTAVTQLTFTYRLTDNGPDNDINSAADNMFDDATVTVTWPVASTLPVSLVNFSGSRNGSYVNLQWTTNIESNNTGFEIQRSAANGVYETIGFVPTKAADGNSGMPLYYQFKEANAAKGNSWYRIVQIDKDGGRTVTAARGVRGLEEISKVTVYPNPGTSGNINVLFGSSAMRDIVITDLNGKVVKQWNSYRDDNMAIGGLRTGVYMLIITNKVTSEKLAHKLVVL
jgi:hypothetical protein